MSILKKVLSFTLILFFVLSSSSCDSDSHRVEAWPEIDKEMKPWVRWWWMGSAVNKEEITYLLNEYSKQGIGGVEIAPIYGAKGYEEQYVEYLSPEWIDILNHTVLTADSLGMGVDMTTGTGWPMGGPNVPIENAAKRLFIQKYEINSNSEDYLKIEINDAKQKNVGAFLISITAYGENGEIEILTDKYKDNVLNWKPKSGNWSVYAAFNGYSRQQVKRAAPGGQGYTFDHLSENALYQYLERFDEAFEGGTPGIRSFFNDSYELFGATWAENLLEEFENRRGYSLVEYMKEFSGDTEDIEMLARIKSDYRETMSEMLIENFSTNWTKWANDKGAKTRNQSHGSPANLLDVYASVDIPEIETFGAEYFPIKGFFWDSLHIKEADHNPLFLKFASSAANITGKKLVSCETFTWLGEHFRVPLSQAKPEAEQLFLSGINHIFYHGTTYSPREAEWPGWLFYASVNFAPSNSFWPHVSGLNNYLARSQSILQNSNADNDFLVYWPVYDIWNSDKGMEMMMSVHSSKSWLQMPEIEELMNSGYSLDFISDNMLKTLKASDNKVVTENGKSSYKAVIVPEHTMMPLETMEVLVELAKKGVPVIMQNFTEDVPGLANLDERRAKFNEIKHSFKTNDEFNGIDILERDGAKIYIDKSIKNALAYNQIFGEAISDYGLKFLRKKSDNGTYYYLVNHTSEDIDEYINFKSEGKNALILDPVSEKHGYIPVENIDEGSKIRVQLQSGEAIFVLITDKALNYYPRWSYQNLGEDKIELTNNKWEIKFTEGGPTLPETVTVDAVQNWTSLDNEEINDFSGTAVYSTTFTVDNLDADDYLLHLEKVNHSAKVFVNGNDLGIVWANPFKINVGKYLVVGENKLEIEVTNLMANRIRYLDRNEVVWRNYHEINFVNIAYRGFDASDWEVMLSGLEGEVSIISLINDEPSPASLLAQKGYVGYNFGENIIDKDFITLPNNKVYNEKSGYGFDIWTKPTGLVNSDKNAISNSPFYFSTDLPEGNYKVTVWVGDENHDSNNTIKAESRRLMVENKSTKAGEYESFSFVINLRTPKISEGNYIRRKPREYGYINWDDKLTIEFNGEKPAVAAIKIQPASKDITTVFLAGNSTVVDQENEPYASWGQMITRFFNNDVVVANYAESGESLRSFKNARRLEKILSVIKPGDYLFVEFGHNDQKHRGEEHTAWNSFTDYLNEFVEKAQEKGGKPVLVTPMQRRRIGSDGKNQPTHGDFPEAVRKVAEKHNIPLIDLQEMSKILYEAWGAEESKNAFVHYKANTFKGQTTDLRDDTHFNNFGAYQLALCIIKGIRESIPELAAKIVDAPDIDLENPDTFKDFEFPYSLRIDALKPDGD